MKLQKVLALTLLAATVGCSTSPVAVKNIATNNANGTIAKVNATGSLTVPVNFPALSKYKTQAYAGGEVQTVFITITPLTTDHRVTVDTTDPTKVRTFAVIRNPYASAGVNGGSAAVTFNNLPVGDVIVSVKTSDNLPKIGNVVIDSSTVLRDTVKQYILNPSTMAPYWGADQPTALSKVTSEAALVLADADDDVAAGHVKWVAPTTGKEGFGGTIATVAAAANTNATVAVNGKAPYVNSYSIPTANVTAGGAITLEGGDLEAGDLAILDTNNNGKLDSTDYVYPISGTSTFSFTPTKAYGNSAQLLIARGLHHFTAVPSARKISVVAGAIDLSKSNMYSVCPVAAPVASTALINNVGGYAIGATALTVDGVDATTKFSAGDVVVINGNAYSVASVAATTVTLASGLIAAVADNDPLKLAYDLATGVGSTTTTTVSAGANFAAGDIVKIGAAYAKVISVNANVLTHTPIAAAAVASDPVIKLTTPNNFFPGKAYYGIYDGNDNLIQGMVTSGGTFANLLAGITVTPLVDTTLSSCMTVVGAPTLTNVATWNNTTGFLVGTTSNSFGRTVTYTTGSLAGAPAVFAPATNFVAKSSVLPAGTYTLKTYIDATSGNIGLKLLDSGSSVVGSYLHTSATLANGATYTLSNTSGAQLLSVTLGANETITDHAGTVDIADVRTTGVDTDTTKFTFAKIGMTSKVITVTGAY